MHDHNYGAVILKLTGSSSNPTVHLDTNEKLPVTGSPLKSLGWRTTVAGYLYHAVAGTLQEFNIVIITNEGAPRQAVCTRTKLLQTYSALPKSIRDLARVILANHLSLVDPAPTKMSK